LQFVEFGVDAAGPHERGVSADIAEVRESEALSFFKDLPFPQKQ
jgi:hypothetical protein